MEIQPIISEQPSDTPSSTSATDAIDSGVCPTTKRDLLVTTTGYLRSDYSKLNGNYLKGCKWSPDGTCLATFAEDKTIRLYNTLPEYLSPTLTGAVQNEQAAVLSMKEPGMIYDTCWYPLMNSQDPATCCIFSSSQHSPVHLFDAYSGSVRASYRSMTHLETIKSATAIACDPLGAYLYCGFNDTCIHVFDISTPGFTPCRKITNEDSSQTGIVSSIAFNHMYGVFAMGTLNGTVGLYASTNENVEQLDVLNVNRSGVTHIGFSTDLNKILIGGRKDSDIACWDLRRLDNRLCTFKRVVNTHQRIYFDVSNTNDLWTGNTDGNVSVWNLNDTEKDKIDFVAHADCVNGVSFNSVYNLLATSSGQRRYPTADIKTSTRDSDESDDVDSELVIRTERDNSVKIWQVSRGDD